MPVSMLHPGNPYNSLKRIFALCLFACFASGSFAQENTRDSLLAVIKTAAEDTNKVNALNGLARITINEDFDKAKGQAKQALAIAKKLPAERSALKGIANAYHVLGIIAFFEDDFPGALQNYSESLAIRKKIGDRKGIAASQNNMALIYSDMGNYPEALKSHYASLKIEEEEGDKQAAGLSYNNIGNINEALEEYAEAIRNFEKAIALGKEVGDKQGMGNAYNNIGIVFKKQGKYNEALKNYTLALELRKEVGYPKGIFESYNNIGIIYYTLGNYEEALKNHELSLAISTKANYELGTANSKLNIAIVYLKQKQFAKAETLLNDALNYYKSIQYKESIAAAYEALTALYSDQKDYKRAMDYLRLYVSQKDSLLNNNTKKELLQSAMKYEYEKKEAVAKVEQEKKEAIQNEELEKRATQIKLYIALCVLIVIVFVGVFLQMRNKRNTEKLRLENSLIDLEQKALRLQMNPHFIFNALNSIQGFITENNQSSARKYLSKFARLMRLIMENSANKTVSLQNEIDVLNDYLELTRLRFPEKFTFEIEVDEQIDVAECEIPPMLLQPFVENAVLHGLAAKESDGRIGIRFLRKQEMIECVIEDNGLGRKQAMEKKLHSHKSTGMLVTEERLKAFGEQNEVKANLQIIDLFDNFGNACGTRVILDIPMQLNWT
jgi:tetratricopeptide (TPR) repeat protein